ncbi:MAG: heparinase II/III family protein, partial [Paracoccaceae bacterium]
ASVRRATGFALSPEPHTLGAYARGRQLLEGNLHFAGMLVQAPDTALWDVAPPDLAWEEELHSFGWLDDLATVPDPAAQHLAQLWVLGWLDRFHKGETAIAWEPGLTGQRLMRCIQHGALLTRDLSPDNRDRLLRSLAAHVMFLNRRWSATKGGPDRFAALCGLVYGGLMLRGQMWGVSGGLAALGQTCDTYIDATGGVPNRNPEELLDIFTLLTWVSQALTAAQRPACDPLDRAIARIAPTLRALRHSDGSLARFHGGGRGTEGRLEQALSAAPSRRRRTSGLAMGYARLAAGRTSVVIDAAPPPQGDASLNAHAATLAFELTSGRRPIVGNCGSGAIFGEAWRRAGRATPSHSTLAIEDYSSARLGPPGQIGAIQREMLEDTPQHVPVEVYDRDHSAAFEGGHRFEGAHDGYVSTHGLTHARLMELAYSGGALTGEDLLLALTDADKRRFDQRKDEMLAEDDPRLAGVLFALRFHLHPDVDATEADAAAYSPDPTTGQTTGHTTG